MPVLQHEFASTFPHLSAPTPLQAFGSTLTEAHLTWFNASLGAELGITGDLHSIRALFTDHAVAQRYSGHQFGSFNPQLGDGRAALLGEVTYSPNDDLTQPRLVDLHAKGIGRTPLSKPGSDGMMPLGAALREALIGEYFHACGVPTSRALAVLTLPHVVRAPRPGPGTPHPPAAVLIRVADHHIRIGTLEFCAIHQLPAEDLLQYATARTPNHNAASETQFHAILSRQAALTAQWMRHGFVHGVLNTDNVHLGGQAIDFGPCAFLDTYQPSTVFSSIDHNGRYAFGNQASITQWNLARLAEAMLTLEGAGESGSGVETYQEALDTFPEMFRTIWTNTMAEALGINTGEQLQQTTTDILFHRIAMELEELSETHADYSSALALRNPDANPQAIPRNAAVNAAILEAEQGNLALFHGLITVLAKPYRNPADTLARADAPAHIAERLQLLLNPPSKQEPFTTYCGT